MAAVLFVELPSANTGRRGFASAAAFSSARARSASHFAVPAIYVILPKINSHLQAWRILARSDRRSFPRKESPMTRSPSGKAVLFYLRMTMAWTFLYAASHQVFVPNFSVVGFLQHTKTFHDAFAVFTTPTLAPATTFLVEYGHLLIGLSLLFGLMVRVSAAFGVLLMIVYWFAHMDWPFIENTNNLIVDYHLVYAGVLVALIVGHAGHVFGLDAWAEKLDFVRTHPTLKPLVA
jgi:thiosulfate dehydrogenase [quinone] large subunit